MKFIKTGDIYKAVKITGPSHNFLGIALSENNISDHCVKIIDLEKKSNDSSKLQANDIIDQVRDGLNEANMQLNKKYLIKEIYFLNSDTPSPYIYKELTKAIILRIDTCMTFNN